LGNSDDMRANKQSVARMSWIRIFRVDRVRHDVIISGCWLRDLRDLRDLKDQNVNTRVQYDKLASRAHRSMTEINE
jgi:hypothetical protein